MSGKEMYFQEQKFQWTEAESMPMFVYRADISGEIIYANGKFLELFECESWKEFVDLKGGNAVCNVIHEGDLQRVVAEVRKQQNNNSYGINKGEYRIVTKSNEVVYIEDIGKFVMDEEYGPLIYVYMFHKTFQISGYDLDRQTNLPREQRFLKFLEEQINMDVESRKLDVVYYNMISRNPE